jgi:pectate lyase
MSARISLLSQVYRGHNRKVGFVFLLFLLFPNVLTAAYEGFGAATQGGKHGQEVEVTSLADSGPGSLREAIRKGDLPRRIVFRISGTVQLQRPLKIKQQSFITIDGATAPAPGITLAGNALHIQDSHDIILSHLRVRNSKADGITVKGSHHIVIDHCSLTDAGDENIGITQDCHDITVSWCLIGDTRTVASGLRPKGLLIANFDKRAVTNISLHHNLFLHEAQRSPQVSTPGLVDIRNNLILHWQAYGIRMRRGARGNIVNNVFKTTENAGNAILLSEGPGPIYISGNKGPGEVDVNQLSTARKPFVVAAVTTDPASEIEQKVMQRAGAQPRDAADRILVSRPPPPPSNHKLETKRKPARPRPRTAKDTKMDQPSAEDPHWDEASERESMP